MNIDREIVWWLVALIAHRTDRPDPFIVSCRMKRARNSKGASAAAVPAAGSSGATAAAASASAASASASPALSATAALTALPPSTDDHPADPTVAHAHAPSSSSAFASSASASSSSVAASSPAAASAVAAEADDDTPADPPAASGLNGPHTFAQRTTNMHAQHKTSSRNAHRLALRAQWPHEQAWALAPHDHASALEQSAWTRCSLSARWSAIALVATVSLSCAFVLSSLSLVVQPTPSL